MRKNIEKLLMHVQGFFRICRMPRCVIIAMPNRNLTPCNTNDFGRGDFQSVMWVIR